MAAATLDLRLPSQQRSIAAGIALYQSTFPALESLNDRNSRVLFRGYSPSKKRTLSRPKLTLDVDEGPLCAHNISIQSNLFPDRIS